MLVPLMVLGFVTSSLAVLFIAVSLTVAILRLVSYVVLAKDRSVHDEDDHEDGRAAASIFDSEDIIGGSPLHLPQPIGPTGTSFSFHVYAPPSVDKEIPKVDLVGTLDFLTKGKVRKFVPIGAKRLLVVNLQEMTLEVYLPKRGRKYKKKKKKKPMPNQSMQMNNGKQADLSTIASLSDDARKTSRIFKSSGINISTKKVAIEDNVDEEEDADDVEFEADDNEEVWSHRYFEAAPKTVIKLDDLISVSALSPNRYGGVIEILSCSPKDESKLKRVPMGKEKESAPEGSLTQPMEEIESPPQKSFKSLRRPSLLSENREDLSDAAEMEEWWRGSNSPLARNGTSTTSFVTSLEREVNENAAKLIEESVIAGVGIDEANDADEINTMPTEVSNDEFVFRSPRDAAEFQRIVMALRTSGKEIQQIYETLETLQANSVAHFPTIEKQDPNSKKGIKNSSTAKVVPRFVSPGVALDDAWRCLNDVTVVNAGLSQYKLYSLMKSDRDDDIIAAAASNNKNVEIKEMTKNESESNNEGNKESQKRKEIYEHYRRRRALLGIRDFFSLFVPPIPADSPAVPHFSTCVAAESSLARDCKFSGVEVHQLRLRLASALQLRVANAALYVRAYARAKAVVQEGWQLDLINQEEQSSLEEENGEGDMGTTESPTQITQKMTRLAYDNERENLVWDVGAQNECYEPAAFPSQGYQLVGWHRFAIPPPSEREQFWLSPDKDPIETIPSLKQIVTRHSDLHFIVVSFFNDKVNAASYFLLVRSLPIGVDESFDVTMDNFVNSSAKDRDKRFDLRLSVAPGHSWSSFAKVAIQFVTVALFGGKKVTAFGAERSSRISFPGMPLSNVTKLNHFGGSMRENSSPTNYVALNAHLTKTTLISLLLQHITIGTCSVDYAVAVNPGDDAPGRVLSVIRMANVDNQKIVIPSTYMPSLESEIVEDDTSLSVDDEIEPTSAVSFWGKVLTFGKPAKKLSLAGASGEKRDELYSDEIDIIYEILDEICVPAIEGDHTRNKLVRLNLTRADIERFLIACECDVNAAVARIIKSQTWRFATFPIDQRLCRIELESGQFFQKGKDKWNNPIFVFRNSLPTHWAGDVRSTMLMVLHRLETFLSSRSGFVKVTVIILTGCECPSEVSSKKKPRTTSQGDGEHVDVTLANDGLENGNDAKTPKIDPETTKYHIHSNYQLVQQMYELLSFHYPERLNKALIVPSKAFSKRRISNFALSPITQTRVVVLNAQADLKKYVAESELKTLGLAT